MSLTITQLDLIRRAFVTLGVYGPTESINAQDTQQAQQILAELIDNWTTQALTVSVVERHVYDLVAGQGGPDNPYTLGPNGDWDTGTAVRPGLIRNALLKLNTSDPAVEIPLAIVTDDMYANEPIKEQENSQASWLYYKPTSPLGQVFLWNVPDADTNQVALYTDLLVPQFASLSAEYTVPTGAAKAFRLCLARDLVTSFAVDMGTAQLVTRDADQALLDFKMANAPMADLSMDSAYTPNLHGNYVIQTDQGA